MPARGRWRAVFFWELWNYRSLAKWVYTVPFVQRWPIFAMPLLGYTGYLPFGLECVLAVAWLDTTPRVRFLSRIVVTQPHVLKATSKSLSRNT